jgi:hypothetical protein
VSCTLIYHAIFFLQKSAVNQEFTVVVVVILAGKEGMTPDKQRGSGASHKDLHTALDYLDEPIECSDHYEGNQSRELEVWYQTRTNK